MEKLKVGDRVRIEPIRSGEIYRGIKGTVTEYCNLSGRISNGKVYHMYKVDPFVKPFDEDELVKLEEFNINEYQEDKYAMLCESRREAEELCNYLDSIGRTWINGDI